MDEVIKKRTVIDRIKKAYISHCRGLGIEAGADIYLGADDIPKGAGIDFNELGSILLAIEKDPKYVGLISLEAIDVDGKRASERRDCYRITVSSDIAPRGISIEKKPKIMLSRGWWSISMPGKKEVRVAKEGTLTGELLNALGTAWGIPRTAESVYERLKKTVKNKATEGGATITQLKDSVREINRVLDASGYRRIRFVAKKDKMTGTWRYHLALEPLKASVVSVKTKNASLSKKRKK